MRLPRFCFEGDMLAPTASGRMIRELLHAARRLEMPLAVNVRHRYGPELAELATPFLRQVAERPPTGKMRLTVGPVFSWPERFERGTYWAIGGFDCIHPLSLELDRMKKPERLWVPTEAHVEVALAAGVPASKIDVMIPSVNRRVFHHDHEAPSQLEKARPFRILAVVNPLRRKGIDLILRAYLEEFRPNEPVTLILKMTHLPKLKKSFPYEIADLAKRLGAINSLFPNVQVIAESWTDEQLAGLMANCNVLVSANRAYHTGLVVREAMACALPVIGPAVLSRILDFDEECGYPVSTHTARVPAEYLFSGAPEASVEEIDIPGMRARMRETFANRDAARRKGKVAQSCAAKGDEWQTLAERIRNAAPLVPIRTIEGADEAESSRPAQDRQDRGRPSADGPRRPRTEHRPAERTGRSPEHSSERPSERSQDRRPASDRAPRERSEPRPSRGNDQRPVSPRPASGRPVAQRPEPGKPSRSESPDAAKRAPMPEKPRPERPVSDRNRPDRPSARPMIRKPRGGAGKPGSKS